MSLIFDLDKPSAVVGSGKNAKDYTLYLVKPGFSTAQMFTNQFVQRVQPFQALRFMDWMNTNNNPVISWSDRVTPATFAVTGTKGVPYEDVINLANTVITSPVSGFVGKRTLDPGGWVSPNSTSFISVVDISTVRMVAAIVEKDLRRISSGMKAVVTVDAYPGKSFDGRIAQVAPVLDPATRTAQIEVEINNANSRLKPGMYAKVDFVVERRPNTLVVPSNSVIELNGKKGVFMAEENVAKFKPVSLGMTHPDIIEVVEGLNEGMRVVSTGAAALREGDRIVLLGQGGGRGGRGGRGGTAAGGTAAGGNSAGRGPAAADAVAPASGGQSAPASAPRATPGGPGTGAGAGSAAGTGRGATEGQGRRGIAPSTGQ